MSAARGRLGRGLYFGLLALVLAAHLAVIAPGFWLTRVWEDEGYNLTVPLNLIAGLGYSSDGILSVGRIDPFDVRISTGPVVLLPIAAVLATGVDTVIGARIVMALFYAGAVAAVFLAGRRIGGRWGALAAVATLLALDVARYPSPLQGPTDILGEWPAVLFTALAVVFAVRRPLLAGLMLGLALQCKNLAVLSLPVLALVVLLASGGRLLRRAGRLALFLGAAAVPTLLFELAKLLSLGPAGYLDSTRAFVRFLRTGGQEGVLTSRWEKLGAIAGGWFVPAPVFVAVGLLAAGVLVALILRRRAVPAAAELLADRHFVWGAVAAAGIAATWVAWWLWSVHDPIWLRHPAPGLLLGVPLVLAAAVRAALTLARADPLPALRVTAAAIVAVTALVPAVQVGLRVADAYTPRFETLAEQRRAVQVAEEYPGDQLRGRWGAIATIATLAGKRAVLDYFPADPAAPWLIETFDGAPAAIADQEERVSSLCGSDIRRVGGYVLCRP